MNDTCVTMIGLLGVMVGSSITAYQIYY